MIHSLGWRLRFSEWPGRCSWSTFGTRHCCTLVSFGALRVSILYSPNVFSWLRISRCARNASGSRSTAWRPCTSPDSTTPTWWDSTARRHGENMGENTEKTTELFCIHGMWEWNEIRREGDRSKSLKMLEGASWKLQGQLPATCGGANAGEDDRKNRDEPSTKNIQEL